MSSYPDFMDWWAAVGMAYPVTQNVALLIWDAAINSTLPPVIASIQAGEDSAVVADAVNVEQTIYE